MLITGLFCIKICDFLASLFVLAEGAITSEKKAQFDVSLHHLQNDRTVI